jgi:hypothetical protein
MPGLDVPRLIAMLAARADVLERDAAGYRRPAYFGDANSVAYVGAANVAESDATALRWLADSILDLMADAQRLDALEALLATRQTLEIERTPGGGMVFFVAYDFDGAAQNGGEGSTIRTALDDSFRETSRA